MMHTYQKRLKKRGKRGGINTEDIATIRAYTANIENVLSIATERDVKNGLQWYATANRHAKYLAETYGTRHDTAIAVISALSPGMDWDRNIVAAENVMNEFKNGGTIETLPSNVAVYGWKNTVHKAWGILTEENDNPLLYFRRGSKTYNFYINILKPSDAKAVTVDSHAFNIAEHGTRRLGSSTVPGLTQKRYDIAAISYVHAARKNDLLPSELQAITWVTYRQIEFQRGTVA